MKVKEQAVAHNIKVGDIFYTSWGYDQTNIDWYQIVGVTPKGVKVSRLKSQKHGEDGFMTGMTSPAIGDFDKDEQNMLKRVKQVGWNEKEPKFGFLINNRYPAYPWDGKPKRESWYA